MKQSYMSGYIKSSPKGMQYDQAPPPTLVQQLQELEISQGKDRNYLSGPTFPLPFVSKGPALYW